MTKPKNEIWLKGVCVNKSVNKKGMFPNPMLHKLYPRIFTQEGYIVTSTFFLDREVWLTKDLTKEDIDAFKSKLKSSHTYIQNTNGITWNIHRQPMDCSKARNRLLENPLHAPSKQSLC